jgi:hypothetical protein
MKHLRHLSTRPELVVDPHARGIIEPADPSPPFVDVRSIVGRPAWFGRARVIFALPTNGAESGPVQLRAPAVLRDADSHYVADPDGNLIGVPGVWCHRFLAARWTEDTRRIAVS